jgi:hypothetical protein
MCHTYIQEIPQVHFFTKRWSAYQHWYADGRLVVSEKKIRIFFSIVKIKKMSIAQFNPLNAELNPICHLLALAGTHHFVDVSRIRVNLI